MQTKTHNLMQGKSERAQGRARERWTESKGQRERERHSKVNKQRRDSEEKTERGER